ncbi:energy-coupling factor transporter transmembrane component T family protein [Fructilactobacillus fructivorans]|uniref:energy-coupling factor transporter transmembrane component T family protein n=1 Tax=Fructilactobacillus fructivorans TaxID=1614 RepID=UPI0002196D38|nr:energy-coupling factor transporter transmembrane component T [Fructilactobacillus fructivorans]
MFGKYFPGNSFIHQLNPAFKILGSIVLITLILMCNNWASYGCMTVITLTLVYLSHSRIKMLLRGVKPILWLIIFTVLIQILFGHGGTVYFHLWFISITSLGIINAMMIFVRLLLIIIIATILTITTSPSMIALGVETILVPLKWIKVPTETIGMMVSIALQFIPTLIDELDDIMNAQRARGVDFGKGKLIKRAQSLVSLIIPLFISSFRHAEHLADAMEARGYSDEVKRSHYQLVAWTKLDWIALLFMILLTAVVVLVRS